MWVSETIDIFTQSGERLWDESSQNERNEGLIKRKYSSKRGNIALKTRGLKGSKRGNIAQKEER